MASKGPDQSSASALRIGFVPLIDAAPLIAAVELGYFADEGLRVSLERQIGWGNVRDKLMFGHLQASHALVGLPPMSVVGAERFPEPLTSIMSLGAGGNAITLGRRLTDAGIDSPAELIRHARRRGPNQPIVLAHVFNCSMHHLLLRDWLGEQLAEVEKSVRLCVLPPPQMNRQLDVGTLDGFCSGEPWNTSAETLGLGKIVAVTTQLLPDHPEKVLAVNRRWLDQHRSAAESLVRATLRGCQYCSTTAHYPELANMLAQPHWLDAPADLLLRSLTIDRWFGGASRRLSGAVRDCSPAMTFPSATHGAWVLKQMTRWKLLPLMGDVLDLARQAVDSGPYRRAAEALNISCPDDDAPPMRLASGFYDPKREIPEPPVAGAAIETRPQSHRAVRTRKAARQGVQ